MPTDHRSALANIKRFDQLIAYLRDEMGWPIARDSFEDVDDLFYDFTADELGIDPKTAAKITEIKRLKPLSTRQPWGIFFVKFEPKKLPVVALRRILSQVALKKRASANSADRTAWAADDLLFVSNYGEGDERQISFAHFSKAPDGHDLPTLKVLGWDNLDTALHLDAVAKELTQHLAWPDDDADVEAWRKGWRGAFTLRHGEVVTTSKELSIRLAKLAGDIRDRIKSALAIETDRGPLTKLMKAFQTSLVHDLDADGFADMYAQTIAYGLLSARIADPHKKTVDDFAGHMRTNPFLRELMETFLKVGGRRGKAGGPGIDFDELGVSEVVQLLDDANMEAVVLDFGDKNPQEDPVIHFYELFLKEYDARKRMQRGVFYTPRPVVSYIVRSVDELLRTEFGLEDGLADTTTWGEMAKRHKDLKIPEGTSPDQVFVQILDPATGTGTFLVEVIDIIHKTMAAKWKAQGHGEKKMAALWNEYVPKHLLTRLHAYELLMAPYAIAHLKVGLKLYETGYAFGSDKRARIYLTNALEPAQDFSGTFEFAIPALAHEAQAVNEVKRKQRFTVVIGNPPYSKSSANRTAAAEGLVAPYKASVHTERNVQPLSDDYLKFMGLSQELIYGSGGGVHGMVSNRGYLVGVIHRGVREALLSQFGVIQVCDLHGDSNVGELPPAGQANDNVFDIQQGVAIGVFAMVPAPGSRVSFREVWGTRVEKSAALSVYSEWQMVSPIPPFYLFARVDNSSEDYRRFSSIEDIFGLDNGGIKTHRDDLVIDFDKASLIGKLRHYIASKAEDGFEDVRRALRNEPDWEKRVRPILYRPFDQRWIFYEPRLIDRPRADVAVQMLSGRNLGLVSVRQVPSGEFTHAFVSRHAIEMKTGSHDRGANLSPLWLDEKLSGGLASLFDDSRSKPRFTPNLSKPFLDSLSRQVGRVPDAVEVLGFIYSILFSGSYRALYRDELRMDYARIPIPRTGVLFESLARLGSELVALHLTESPKLDHFITAFTGPKKPEVGRVGWSNDTVWLDAAATKKGQPATPGTIGFRGVPEAVWNFHIGGYQVCEKWLKDRKGRTLSKDDISHYQKIVVALNETIRLMKEIDEVIEQHGG
ncbi:MAG: type ISP restriction/modification enzyme, partial [bacterium]